MLFLILSLSVAPAALSSTSFSFSRFYVDTDYGGNSRPGFVRAGDMDNDGDIDIVAGGGLALFIYENDGAPAREGWPRHGSLDATAQIGLNGACLFDVDDDDDLDVVGAKFYSDLGWWENPGPPLKSSPWTFHKLASTSAYLHDFILVDLDGDGLAGECLATLNSGSYWDSDITIRCFRPGADPRQLWESYTVESLRNEGSSHCHAGLDVGDVDRDGHIDIGFSNGWYEAPDSPSGSWTWHQVTTTYGISNAALRDLDADGDLDLVVACGHHGTGVFWFECPPDPVNGSWTTHTVDSSVVNPEGLAVLNLDRDGDYDIIACDLDFDRWNQEVHRVYIYENIGTIFTPAWNQQDISGPSYPSHKLQAVDINLDGREDIISEAAGYSVISYYENTTILPTDYAPILDHGDYDGDGTSDPAVFRSSTGLWAVRGVTRVYFGGSADVPVSGDYNRDGISDIGIFRGSSGLWAVRGITRAYFGSSADTAVPGDYNGDGNCDVGIFRNSSGLWAIKGITRSYFGCLSDSPAPGYYDGDATKDIGIFRGSSGLWAIRNVTRVYFGSSSDTIFPGDYDGDGTWETGIFRGSSGLWAIQGVTRSYFGRSIDAPVPADYNGDSRDDIGIFRDSSGLWAVRGISRVYFGGTGDVPVTR
jgi:hypothetical protein